MIYKNTRSMIIIGLVICAICIINLDVSEAIRIEGSINSNDKKVYSNEYEFKMESGNMEDTININDILTISYEINNLKQKDIIAFKYRDDPSKVMIGRIIGLPGSVIKMVDKKIYINGVKINEKYVVHKEKDIIPSSQNPRDNNDNISVKSDEYIILGDNRDRSYDSRFFGPVKRHEIAGKVIKINGKKTK